MNALVRLRPWPAFILFFLAPFLVIVICSRILVLEQEMDFYLIRVINAPIAILYFSWMFAACRMLAGKLPAGIHAKPEIAALALFVPIVYALWIFVNNFIFLTGIGFDWLVDHHSQIAEISPALFGLAALGLLFGLFYMARLLKMAEEGRRVRLIEFIGDFFLIWLVPIGIWNVQSRLNEIAARPQDDMDIFKQEPQS